MLVTLGEGELVWPLLAFPKNGDPGLRSYLIHRLAAIDAELAAAAKKAEPVRADRDWFVNGEGQTFAVVRGPVGFTLGSPVSEPGRLAPNEPAHRKRISRTFALATKEVTVAEFVRFRPEHDWIRRYGPGPDTPATGTAALQKNFLHAPGRVAT